MRYKEFVSEASSDVTKIKVKPHPDQEQVMPSAHRVAGTADRTYDLNRIMMAVAMADGKTVPKFRNTSWAGKNNLAHPYTKEETKMLKDAYKSVGAEWDDALKPNRDQKSLEPKDTNRISPITPFNGYKRR